MIWIFNPTFEVTLNHNPLKRFRLTTQWGYNLNLGSKRCGYIQVTTNAKETTEFLIFLHSTNNKPTMKANLLFLTLFIAFSTAIIAQKKVPVKITCAPDNIVIRELYSDTLNNTLYVFYLYGESYKKSHYELAKYDGKTWSVIAKIKPGKSRQPEMRNICTAGKGLYFIANFQELEDGKVLQADESFSVFSFNNNVLTVLPMKNTSINPRGLISYNNTLYCQVGAMKPESCIYKWNGSSWEISGTPLTGGVFIHLSYAVVNNNLYVIFDGENTRNRTSKLMKFNGSTWTEITLPFENGTLNRIVSSNNLMLVQYIIKYQDYVSIYDGKDFTPLLDENTERIAFPHTNEIVVTYDWGRMLNVNYCKNNFYLSTALGIKVGEEFYSLIKFNEKGKISSGLIPTKKVKREADFSGIHTTMYNGKMYVAVTEYCAPYFPDGDYKSSADNFFYYELE